MKDQRPNGLVEIDNDAYHAGPGISKSHLDAIAEENGKSPLHYWHKYVNPERVRDEPTAAMVMGTAIHTAILEPDLLNQTVVCGLDIPKRSAADKAEWANFEAANAGKIILRAEDYQTVLAVRDAVHKHPVASSLIKDGQTEQSFYATHPETGELIKCRTDLVSNSGEFILDVKSTDDASPEGFARSAANFRYHVQQSWYQDIFDIIYGEHPPYWMFLAVEKKPPYAIGIYYLPNEAVNLGGLLAQRDLRKIVEHKRNNEWPDYGTEVKELLLPGWYMKQAGAKL